MVPYRVIAAGLRTLHDGHPLVVVTKEGEVQIRAAAVRLSANGQLSQQSPDGLRVATILGVHDGVFKPEHKHTAL